jgi:hypothetical protein
MKNELFFQSPPADYDDGQEKPLAKIPLSQLMGNYRVVCPLCGKDLPIDTKDVNIDGSLFTVCKKCSTNK